MKRFSIIISFFITLFLVACNSTKKEKAKLTSVIPNEIQPKLTDKKNEKDTTVEIKTMDETQGIGSDNSKKIKIDTSTLKGKRKWIMSQFLIENTFGNTYDSLLDLNYDGYKDYIIGYYGVCGAGYKYRAEIYFYNVPKKCYVFNEQLSNLPNQTLYLKQKTITGFYIGYGGGGGTRLQWIKNKWVVTKEFEVGDKGDSTKWIISYPTKNKTDTLIMPYQMIPPDEILETNIDWLEKFDTKK